MNIKMKEIKFVKVGEANGTAITLNEENRKKLLEHCLKLLNSASEARTERVNEMASIEQDLLGVSDPVGSDCDRAQSRAEGKGAATPDRIMPFGYLKLLGYASEITSVVLPYEAPYQAAVAVTKQDLSDAITKCLRFDAARFDHRNNIAACIFDGLSINTFAARVTWASSGYAYKHDEYRSSKEHSELLGNKITHLDPYNISYDASIASHEVSAYGEFFAEFDMTSKFQLQRMVHEGELYLTKAQLDDMKPENTHILGIGLEDDLSAAYYYNPKINKGRAYAAELAARESCGSTTDHSGLFGAPTNANTDPAYAPKGYHVTRMQVRLDPTEFGLVPKAVTTPEVTIQIYDITIVNNKCIALAQPAEVAGNRFNVVLGTMSYDRERGRHVTRGDSVAALSAMISDVFNMQRKSMRKGLEGGVTIFNPDIIPLHELDTMHGGRLPARQMRYDGDLRRHVLQLNDVPDTTNSVRNAQEMLGIMDTMLPKNSQPELAGLDRATQFQAQAVAMTGDRNLMQDAAVFDGQLMTPIRAMVHFNIMFNADVLTYIDPRKHEILKISKEQISQSEFILTQPSMLVGIDRLRITNILEQTVNMLLQAGDQLSPLSAAFLKHLIEVAAPVIDMEDYKELVQQTQQQAERKLALQNGVGSQPPAEAPTPEVA